MNDNEMKWDDSAETPVAVADKPRGGLGRPLTALLLALAMVVSMGAAAWMGMAPPLSPLGRVARAAENSLAAYENSPRVKLMNQVSQGGSVELWWNLKPLTQSMLGIGLDLDASVKMYSQKESQAALTADVALAGSPLLDLLLTVSREDIALASGMLLGEEAYGVSLEDFWDNFDGSVFGPYGEYSLGISAAELREELETLEDSEAMADALTPALEQLAAAFLVSLEERAVILEQENIQLDASTVCDGVTIELDSLGLAGMVRDMAEFLRDNQAMKDFLYEYADSMSYSYMDYSGGDMEIDQFYEELVALTDEDFRIMAEDLAAEDVGLRLEFCINQDNEQLIDVMGQVRAAGEYMKMRTYIAPGWEAPEAVFFGMEYPGSAMLMEYRVTADDSSRFEASMLLQMDGEEVRSSISWDKEEGGYTARLTGPDGETYSMTGSLTERDGVVTLSIDEVSAGGQEIPLGVSVIVRATDEMPATPEYTDVLTMDPAELEALLAQLEGALSGLEGMASSLPF